MILHRVGVGDAAVRTGRVGKTVDLFLALAAYREHDFTAVAGRNGACGERFPLVVRQQHYADRVGQYHAGFRLVRDARFDREASRVIAAHGGGNIISWQINDSDPWYTVLSLVVV